MNIETIQDDFKPAIEYGIKICVDKFRDELLSIYLSGSIAFGEAWAGASDADWWMFLDRTPTTEELTWCKEQWKIFDKEFPQIKGYEFNLQNSSMLLKEPVWSFIFKYNSIKLYGKNLISEMEANGLKIPEPTIELVKSRLNWIRNNYQGLINGKIPKGLFPELPKNPFLQSRKIVRNYIILEGAHLLMADKAFIGFQQNKVLNQLRVLYPKYSEIFNLSEKILKDPIEANIIPEQLAIKIKPFQEYLINKIENS